MEKLKVLLDCDGVLCNFVGQAVKIHLEKYPNDQIRPISSWVFSDSFIHKDELEKGFSNPKASGGYLEDILVNAPVYEENREGYKKLCENYDVTIATNRSGFDTLDIEWYTKRWLYYNGFINHKDIIFTNDKSKLEADVLIDDSIDNCYKFQSTHRPAICITRPWTLTFEGVVAANLNEAFSTCEIIQTIKDKTYEQKCSGCTCGQ